METDTDILTEHVETNTDTLTGHVKKDTNTTLSMDIDMLHIKSTEDNHVDIEKISNRKR